MTGQLSSDLLERQFGPTELEILRQDGLDRIIRTRTAGDGPVVLELSRVTFKEPGIGAFPTVHRAVAAGKSMGKAFVGQGIAFERQVRSAHRCDLRTLPASFAEHFGAGGLVTVVEVSIFVGPGSTPYADILEIYGPAVSWPLPSTAAAVSNPSQTTDDRIRAFADILRTI